MKAQKAKKKETPANLLQAAEWYFAYPRFFGKRPGYDQLMWIYLLMWVGWEE